jgi:hypothetical protein
MGGAGPAGREPTVIRHPSWAYSREMKVSGTGQGGTKGGLAAVR